MGRVQLDFLQVQLEVDFEERFGEGLVASFSLAANSVFHGVQGILGSAQKGLIQVPEVVSFDPLGFLLKDGLYMRVQGVFEDGVQEIVHCVFDFDILGNQILGLDLDEILLQKHELVESEGFALILGQRDESDLGNLLEVALDSVFDDVVDVDDQLFESSQTVVHVFQIGVDVHAGPGQSDHSWSQFEF